jgi:uncharacterized protein
MILRTVIAVALLTLVACSSRPPGEGNYVGEVAESRASKDAQLRAADLPIAADKKDAFLPLSYFPVDPAYAVPAAFKENPAGSRPEVEFETSGHERRKMVLLGTLQFTLQGQPFKLGAFAEAGQPADRLFVPFADATTGTDTYQAGRYLDIARSTTGLYVVDFNRAYNPYCYYNPTYDCPYPPKDNRLPIAIRAGERVKPQSGAPVR